MHYNSVLSWLMLPEPELAFADNALAATIPQDHLPDSPYRNLLRALLNDAIEAATGQPKLDCLSYIEARRWLESKTDDWVLPCNVVCFFLEIDQDAMLSALRPRFALLPLQRPKGAFSIPISLADDPPRSPHSRRQPQTAA